MAMYQLTEPENLNDMTCLEFEARELGEALDYARANATGKKVMICQNGHPLCAMELFDDCDVWLVGSPNVLL